MSQVTWGDNETRAFNILDPPNLISKDPTDVQKRFNNMSRNIDKLSDVLQTQNDHIRALTDRLDRTEARSSQYKYTLYVVIILFVVVLIVVFVLIWKLPFKRGLSRRVMYRRFKRRHVTVEKAHYSTPEYLIPLVPVAVRKQRARELLLRNNTRND